MRYSDLCFNKANAAFFGEGTPQDNEAAFRWYEDAALNGHPAALYNLGLMYKYGRGVPQDDALAAAWLEQAAESGNKQANALLAELYHKSSVRNPEKARALYEELALSGSAAAFYNLGLLYTPGDPNDDYQSQVIAHDYFTRAAALGHVGAKIKLSR